MPLSLFDLTHDHKRAVTVTFPGGAELNVTYLPSALNAVNERERIIRSSEAFAGEADALALYMAKLVDGWDLVYHADADLDPLQPVNGLVTIPEGEHRVTVPHPLGWKPALQNIHLRAESGELPAKGHVDKLSAESFDLHFAEDEDVPRQVVWTLVDLGGEPVTPNLRAMRFLSTDLLYAIRDAIRADASPNARRAASS